MRPSLIQAIDNLITVLTALRGEMGGQMMDDEHKPLEMMAKAMAGFNSEWVWAGIAGNCWPDLDRETLHRQWFLDDIARKQKALAAGEIDNFGEHWVDHRPSKRIGVTMFNAVPDGTHLFIAAGPVGPNAGRALYGRPWPMSVHFWPMTNKAGDMNGLTIFENSVVVGKIERNPLTAYRVYQRESASTGAIAQLSGEVL